MTTNSTKAVEDINPPEEFHKIVNDFITDIINTFPEYTALIGKWWNKDNMAEDTITVFRFCVKSFPERFFDILYKNAEMFDEKSDVNTEFLPGIVFKHLWNSDISDTTKDTIWKYLQIILFAVIGSVHNSSDFGDSAKIFEAINNKLVIDLAKIDQSDSAGLALLVCLQSETIQSKHQIFYINIPAQLQQLIKLNQLEDVLSCKLPL